MNSYLVSRASGFQKEPINEANLSESVCGRTISFSLLETACSLLLVNAPPSSSQSLRILFGPLSSYLGSAQFRY